jgi:hypothetical protein
MRRSWWKGREARSRQGAITINDFERDVERDGGVVLVFVFYGVRLVSDGGSLVRRRTGGRGRGRNEVNNGHERA